MILVGLASSDSNIYLFIMKRVLKYLPISIFSSFILYSCNIPETMEGSKAAYITQYGVTWTFDSEYTIGQFVTGDYWVKGPVKIVSISPKSIVQSDGRTVNGSMLNPAVNDTQGYDSSMFGQGANSRYNAALNAGRNRQQGQAALGVDGC